MGGGFPNTELRSLSDERVFWLHNLLDGECRWRLIAVENPNHRSFKRTFLLEDGKVVYKNNSIKPDYKQAQVGTPDYSDLLLDKYISVIEIVNPCTACGVTADGINSRWRTDAIGEMHVL
jgi:hypothetical protein